MARQRAFTALHRAIFHHIRHLDLYFFLAGLYEKHTLVFKNKTSECHLKHVYCKQLDSRPLFLSCPVFRHRPEDEPFIYFLISFTLIVFLASLVCSPAWV